MDLATPYDRIRDFLDRIATSGDDPTDDDDLRLRKHALAWMIIALIPAGLAWAVIGLLVDRPLLTSGSVYFAAAMLVGLLVMASTHAFQPVVRALLIVGMGYVLLGHVALGGLLAGGASLVWGVVAPVSAILYFDRDAGLRWFGGYAAMVIAAIALDPFIATLVPASWTIAPAWIFVYNLLGPGLIVLLLIRYVDGQRQEAQSESRRLLLDMLPASIADRLTRGERLIVETHPSVTVLFADVVNFTGLAETASPRDLLLILNQLFSVFDRLAAKHGLEKIKTMGDSYIAVAGAPTARDDHADVALRMGMEMHREIARMGGLKRRNLRLRVGLASGAITAGVLGQHRYAYDMWGDTVNVASRMESFGEPGMVQVAASTRQLVRDPLPWVERRVVVKGKGEMVTYLLDPWATGPAARRVAPPAADGGAPFGRLTVTAEAAAGSPMVEAAVAEPA
jgi:guanylate cyclase